MKNIKFKFSKKKPISIFNIIKKYLELAISHVIGFESGLKKIDFAQAWELGLLGSLEFMNFLYF